jgi:hypothetical protein
MIACTEAAVRVDFLQRVGNKEKDVLSRRFQDFHREFGDRVRLEEHILDNWRDISAVAATRSAIQKFKGVLGLRHWLAHGRYWRPKLGRTGGYTPVDVFDICHALLKSLA